MGVTMIQESVIVSNITGLHLKPAGVLCHEALKYKCRINFGFKDNIYNAKSILSVLGACVKSGETIHLKFDGEDEEEASSAIIDLINNRFGECL